MLTENSKSMVLNEDELKWIKLDLKIFEACENESIVKYYGAFFIVNRN